MNQFKRKLDKDGNPVNSTTGHPQFQGSAKLLSPLGDKTKPNTNGKLFKVANVEYIGVTGKVARCGATIYEGNYSKGELTVGQEYIATVTVAPDKDGVVTAYMQMSHLVANGGFASVSDFITEEELVEITTKEYDGTTIR